MIDFTRARYAPVINIVVRRPDGKILLVKRSEKVDFYPNYWNGIGGFLDDDKDFEDKVKSELKEELGIDPSAVASVTLGTIFHYYEPEYNKTWIIHPVLAKVEEQKIKLDWEASEYNWIDPSDIGKYKVVPSFLMVFKNVSFK